MLAGTPTTVVDLGSGGGVPGLVLAARWEGATLTLIEAGTRRAVFLRRAVLDLGLEERVRVAGERAETVGRAEGQRGAADVVTARSFGRPAVVAECAAPLLRTGGLLVVSEPPPARLTAREPADARWSEPGLAQLGMGPAQQVGGRFRFAAVRQESPCPDRFPRRVGVPAKRPLF